MADLVSQVASITPGGILIFFPSYMMLKTYYESWATMGMIKKIEHYKSLYREPKDSAEYKFVIKDYYKDVYSNDRKGAILMAVCRGKVSEGLDFSDDAARTVIMVGIPYPMVKDPKTVLKK